MAENWKPIPGYEGIYEASNQGRIYSTPRLRTKGGFLSQVTSVRGYRSVVLYKKGIRKMLLVHRLVAKTFIGNLPDDKQVNHIDFNPSNNTVDNLEICTPVENMVHYYKKNKMKR